VRSGQGFLLVYSIVDYQSFMQLESFRNSIFEARDLDPAAPDTHPPMVLAGNKVDREVERKVPKDEGAGLAARWSMDFFETSAKERIHVEEPFIALIRKSRSKSPGGKSSSSSSSSAKKSKKSGGGGCILL